MRKFILPILVVLATTTSALAEKPVKVAIANMLDSSMTHVYGNRFYATSFQKDVFDYGKYTVEQLELMLEASGMEMVEVEAPLYVNKMAFYNFFGAPSQQIKAWLSALDHNLDADFLIVINRKFAPDDDLSYRFLQKKEYGLATYLNYPDALSFFSFVGYHIFSVKTMKELHLNINHDQYVLIDMRLDNRMTYDEVKEVPEKYLDLAVDKMINIVDTRNVEIKRRLLEHLNKGGR
ncbi:MAG: hypothetical protein ACLFPE_13400 [Bacteroidales bacterium]